MMWKFPGTQISSRAAFWIRLLLWSCFCSSRIAVGQRSIWSTAIRKSSPSSKDCADSLYRMEPEGTQMTWIANLIAQRYSRLTRKYDDEQNFQSMRARRRVVPGSLARFAMATYHNTNQVILAKTANGHRPYAATGNVQRFALGDIPEVVDLHR